jgi:type VI secretion system protein ImpN
MMQEGLYPELTRAYRQLHAALSAIQPEEDRRVARDALRSALDRSQEPDWHRSEILFDSFALEGVIHAGSAFVLHRLRHRDLGTLHVLKTVVDARQHEPVLRAMLLAEGRHMLGLDHEAILTARAVLRLRDGRPALLLDHVNGVTLVDELAHGRRLPRFAVLALAFRLLDALGAIHDAGLLHLDLVPANLLLSEHQVDKALLCDFGLSLPIGACHRDADCTLAATRAFASPEQLAGYVPLDERADLYALGRVIQACLADYKDESLRGWTGRLTAPDQLARPANTTEARLLLMSLEETTNLL